MSSFVPITKSAGEFTGEYIVELKNDESKKIVLAALGIEKATHEWDIKGYGFAGLGGMYKRIRFF